MTPDQFRDKLHEIIQAAEALTIACREAAEHISESMKPPPDQRGSIHPYNCPNRVGGQCRIVHSQMKGSSECQRPGCPADFSIIHRTPGGY